MFGNQFIAEIIARIFHNADKEVRREITDSLNPLEINERERVATLCSLIRQKIKKNPLIRSISIQAHARDTTRRDALFVFRHKEEIKIGLIEAKVLRLRESKLSDIWDWNNSRNQSHFTQQVINQQNWINQAAIWDMFIPNCNIGEYSPPLQREGSSNIWADEIINHPKILRPNELWTYQDVLNSKDQYLSLYDIVKEIFRCNKGIIHDITGKKEIQIMTSDTIHKMVIPIPRTQRFSEKIIEKFFYNNPSIDSFNYYQFDDLYLFAQNYHEKRDVNFSTLFQRNFNPNDHIYNDLIKLLVESYDQYKK